jgi:hypothetical protein
LRYFPQYEDHSGCVSSRRLYSTQALQSARNRAACPCMRSSYSTCICVMLTKAPRRFVQQTFTFNMIGGFVQHAGPPCLGIIKDLRGKVIEIRKPLHQFETLHLCLYVISKPSATIDSLITHHELVFRALDALEIRLLGNPYIET